MFDNSKKLQEQQAREFNSRLNGDYTAASGKGLPGTPRGLMFLPVFEGGLPQVSAPSTLLTTTSGILPPHFPNHLNSSTSPSRQLSPITSNAQNNNAPGNSLTHTPLFSQHSQVLSRQWLWRPKSLAAISALTRIEDSKSACYAF
ncbi:uncharacterized protein CEXT_108121 [Caerostris extrusa]|uniref:Uncharacterized protein n=1 Tax=Caerostris extrusa TaxID=172846 RepID=A0AAV4RB89_CAEEX|nr:uncharacterized protein CEXT_108121 [Caerostris extrusa]